MNARGPTKTKQKRLASGQSATAPAPIPTPAIPPPIQPGHIFPGPPIPPLQRIRLFSPSEWEEFIQEWAQSLKPQYHSVWKCGGAGDLGRDIIAHVSDPSHSSEWDNFQCKHYSQGLRPSDVWSELGKLMFYTFSGAYSIPRKYRFVCPCDVGTTLARLIQKPDALRSELISHWDTDCRLQLRSEPVPLTRALRRHINQYPFDTIGFLPVLDAIEQHSRTPWHVHRFGGGLPSRPPSMTPPTLPTATELPYITQLMRAYTDHKKQTLTTPDHLRPWTPLFQHFHTSRASFYAAESLRAFSRDHLPDGEYQRLQSEIHDGVQEDYLDSHADAFARVLATTRAAVHLPITDHALSSVLQPADKRGICHQLVNDDRLEWVRQP